MKSKFLGSRTLLMGLEREKRSIGFEREDERRAQEKVRVKSEKKLGSSDRSSGAEKDSKAQSDSKGEPTVKKEKIPSVALMGVSMLGSKSFSLFKFPLQTEFNHRIIRSRCTLLSQTFPFPQSPHVSYNLKILPPVSLLISKLIILSL